MTTPSHAALGKSEQNEWELTQFSLPSPHRNWGPACWKKKKRIHLSVQGCGLILGSGRSPGTGNGNPLQYSWKEPGSLQSTGFQRVRHDWACIHACTRTLKTYTHTHTHTHTHKAPIFQTLPTKATWPNSTLLQLPWLQPQKLLSASTRCWTVQLIPAFRLLHSPSQTPCLQIKGS